MRILVTLGIFLIIVAGIVAYKGINIHHTVESPPGKQKIKIPAHDEIIEIPRKNGRPPFQIKRHVPEKEIEIDRTGGGPLPELP